MKYTLVIAILITMFTRGAIAEDEKVFMNESTHNPIAVLKQKQWIHGSQDCKSNQDHAIEVFQ
ncbi:MAG TPA: MBL fold metallo-hydrolase, partial [Colwellia sp.]|nr:MBL fold metallo-hydrolase [Colwellia sp.]